MGSQQTSSKVAVINHPKLNGGTITMYKQIIVESNLCGNYTEWLKGLQNIKEQNKLAKAAFFLPTVQQSHHNGLCGVDIKLKLYFQVFPFTLYQQIQKRKQENNQQFTQGQLWFLIYHLTYASSIMQRKKKKCGDIRPRNILINQQGNIGIITLSSFPDEKTNYYKSLTEQQITYLAPEELHDLEDMVPCSRVDPSIAESFSIGLTLLDVATLNDHQQLYCLNPVSFKNQIFNANILQLKKRNLSPFLIRTILNMLEPKAFNRPSPGQTFSIILPYEKQILQMEQFIPDKQKSKQSLQQFQGKIK